MRIEEDLKLGSKTFLSVLNVLPSKAVPMSNWNVNSPLNTQVRPGLAYRLSRQIWIPSGRLKWRKRWLGSIF
ncbi:Uncharacterised protein [Salmonella enterica subsp. arizonae]|uniref:Uncharacterized protein n=1 Tax=Salmonella enterica subsp. arizonae TaxID=59203 RepID=A0A379SBF7_SALER|nr:Uncharacterised protein [Salmonella enterica subsp. arizonae]